MIDAKIVMQLRAMTDAGMMDAKAALEESGGDLEKATEILRKKGVAKADKKAERVAKEGRIFTYLHSNNRLAAMVELYCETDFVAKTEQFQNLGRDLAMHVAATAPRYVRREEVPAEIVEKEKETYRAEIAEQNKPAEIVEKIVEGKLNKFYSEVCLLEQLFIKDDTKTVEIMVKEVVGILGENMQVGRFTRMSLGE
ncbi:MAG: translation elongation factor Ts [Patescibacteria group bacterium]|jgi:elongation factor Ts